MLYVGRRQYENGSYTDYTVPGTETILTLTKSTEYGCLSPYCLTVDGYNMENLWQFGKLYPSIEAQRIKKSAWDPTIIWQHPAEVHCQEGKLTPEYWNWRLKGFGCPEPVRYPVGYHQRHNCLGYIFTDPFLPPYNRETKFSCIDYITARNMVYIPLYKHCISQLTGYSKEKYQSLIDKLKAGKSLTIVEVDGPKSQLMDYYRQKYQVPEDFIVNNCVLATKDNLSILRNDDKSPYGHGYCLAECLLESLDN